MDATEPLPTTTDTLMLYPRHEPFRHLCANNTRFWSCDAGSFRGCCSHDPCHEGGCQDLEEAREYLAQKKRNLQQGEDIMKREENLATETYTLVHVTDAVRAVGVINPALATVKIPTPTNPTVNPILPNKQLTATSSATTASTASICPTTAPVPGSQRSGRSIASISLGVIVAAIIIGLLSYLCISRLRRQRDAASSARKKRLSRLASVRNRDVDIFMVDGDGSKDNEPFSPSGARLEAQRGRRVLDEGEKENFGSSLARRTTGFRVVGMTAAGGGSGMDIGRDSGERKAAASHIRRLPNLRTLVPPIPPLPVAPEHPASHIGIGMGALSAGLLHPAYRNSVDSFAGKSHGGNNIQGREELASLDTTTNTPAVVNAKRASWVPGTDVIEVISAKASIDADIRGTSPPKPRFHEATARWATVASPEKADSDQTWAIGQALTTPQGMGCFGEIGRRRSSSVTAAMSTENEITSPVEDGGLSRPIRRHGFRGFEELLDVDGNLKAKADVDSDVNGR